MILSLILGKNQNQMNKVYNLRHEKKKNKVNRMKAGGRY